MRRRWVFHVIIVIITVAFVAANLPRIALADHWATGWKAGWPLTYETWGVTPDGTPYAHHFSSKPLLGNILSWLALVVFAWLVIWPRKASGLETRR
jgi:hypothetical protein